MPPVLRISDAASLAIHSLICMGVSGGEMLSVATMADRLGVSEAHLGKVLQRLVHQGYLKSRRGPGGGFVLGRPADQITLLEIFETVDGPLVPVTCLLQRQECMGTHCCLGPVLGTVHELVGSYLANARLSDFLPSSGTSAPSTPPDGTPSVP